MLREQFAVFELLRDIIKGKTGDISKVSYFPQKPSFLFDKEIEQPFPRAVPETQGISSEMLAEFIQELSDNKQTDVHQMMILRNGYVIAECSFAPYQKGIWHATYSMCKSITGMAIGMLIEEGRLDLDERIVNIFERKGIFRGVKQKNLTVRHLLTMTAGVAFNESGIVSGDDWVKSYMESPVRGTPGEKFEYNSMNTYMLSAIVTELTGQTMMEYLYPRLWEPLGITKIFWETCPKGITKGGWGLFICPEDAAKLGQLYLNKGKWRGKQIVPEKWIESSTQKSADTPSEMGDYGYGYQIWMGSRPGSFTFNGMLGQNVVVYPDIQMVIVLNAGSNELFQNCVLLEIVKKYFEGEWMPEATLPENSFAFRRLKEMQCKVETQRREVLIIPEGGWKKRKPVRQTKTPDWSKIRYLDGKTYELSQKRVGLFPLIMQVFHNNFTEGISHIGFVCRSSRLYLQLLEGNELHQIEVGFQKAAVTEIRMHEEPYLIAVKGRFTADEDGHTVLKLNLAFLEEAVRRKINIYFLENGIEICWDETPGKELIAEGLEAVLSDVPGNAHFNNLKGKTNIDFAGVIVEQTIRPVTAGRLMEAEEPGVFH